MRAYRDDLYGVVGSYRACHFIAQHAARCAGLHYFAENMARQAEFVNEGIVPVACTGVKKLGCRGYGILVVGFPGQEEAEKVGHEQQMACGAEQCGSIAAQCHQTEKGIYGHHLRAVDGIMFLSGTRGEKFLGQPFYGLVAIAYGIADEVALVIDETEVDAPGIDTYAPQPQT